MIGGKLGDGEITNPIPLRTLSLLSVSLLVSLSGLLLGPLLGLLLGSLLGLLLGSLYIGGSKGVVWGNPRASKFFQFHAVLREFGNIVCSMGHT